MSDMTGGTPPQQKETKMAIDNNQTLVLEIKYLGNGGNEKKFNCFYMGNDDVDTLSYFENLRKISMDTKIAPFFVDIKDNGDISDTIGISNEVFTKITGQEVKEPEYYEKADRSFWEDIEKIAHSKWSLESEIEQLQNTRT